MAMIESIIIFPRKKCEMIKINNAILLIQNYCVHLLLQFFKNGQKCEL